MNLQYVSILANCWLALFIYFIFYFSSKTIFCVQMTDKATCFRFLDVEPDELINDILIVYEPSHGKTNNLHRRKQRCRSASQ